MRTSTRLALTAAAVSDRRKRSSQSLSSVNAYDGRRRYRFLISKQRYNRVELDKISAFFKADTPYFL